MVGVGVAGQRPVGGAAGLEAAGAPGRAGAPVSPHLGGGAATAARAAHSAGAGGGGRPAVTVPGARGQSEVRDRERIVTWSSRWTGDNCSSLGCYHQSQSHEIWE